MIKALVVLAAVLCVARPAAADGFFGLSDGDAQAMMGKALADQERYEAELAERRAAKAAGPGWIDRKLGTYETPEQDFECIYRAVAFHLGQAGDLGRAPTVHLESRTLFEDFQQASYNEEQKWPNAFATTYLAKADAVFLDDHAALYSRQRHLDDAAAGQFAIAVLVRHGTALEEAKSRAPGVETWFHEAYTSRGSRPAACDPR